MLIPYVFFRNFLRNQSLMLLILEYSENFKNSKLPWNAFHEVFKSLINLLLTLTMYYTIKTPVFL